MSRHARFHSHLTPAAWALASVLLSAGFLVGQTTLWNTNGSGVWYSPGGVNIGIGTSTPLAPLDSAGSSYKLSASSAVKELNVSFANGAPNEKVDLFIGVSADGIVGFWGVLDVEITDTFANQNAVGVLHKRFYLGLNTNKPIWTNESRVVDEGGTTADNYAISDLSWNAAQSNYKITIVHRVSTLNAPRIRLTAYAQSGVDLGTILDVTASSVYTTDTTVYPRPAVYFNNSVGFGTSTPAAPVHARAANPTDGGSVLKLESGTPLGAGITFATSQKNNWQMFGTGTSLKIGEAGVGDWMTFTPGGKIGIGNNNPANTLSVNGTIGAKEVIVASSGADYVFDPAYRLRPLSDVEEFIRANHHLPDLPSAAEGKKNGVSVGEMQAKLLAKIEELTLHVIEADKRNQDLAARVAQLEAELQ